MHKQNSRPGLELRLNLCHRNQIALMIQVIGGVVPRLQKASYLATGAPVAAGAPIAFEQTKRRLFLRDLPEENPDPIAGACVIKLEFDGRPRIDRSVCREG